jgi:hypothetical protein
MLVSTHARAYFAQNPSSPACLKNGVDLLVKRHVRDCRRGKPRRQPYEGQYLQPTQDGHMLELVGTKQDVLARQSLWARSRSLSPDSRGYLPTYAANLFKPLSDEALACFQKGSGNELLDIGDRPAKMRATHSSSALAVNVFDYWSDSPDAVLNALGLPTPAVRLAFESQFETGLGGTPPNLDVCFELANRTVIGIESKFTEWLTPQPLKKELFKPKYFPAGPGLWGGRGMQSAQTLAEDLRDGRLRYRYLNAAQLLKHALGLSCSAKPFHLVYLYFDVRGREGEAHISEVQDFAARLGGDVSFHYRTYQGLFELLQQNSQPHDDYVNYLRSRYFS